MIRKSMKKNPQGDRGRNDAHSGMQFVRVCVEVISLHLGPARCTHGTFSLTKEIAPLFFPVVVLQLSHTRARQLFHPTSMEESLIDQMEKKIPCGILTAFWVGSQFGCDLTVLVDLSNDHWKEFFTPPPPGCRLCQ